MTWLDALDEGERRIARHEVPFTEEQVSRAHNWLTCACEELAPRIPRWLEDGAPRDEQLYELGCLFAARIRWSCFHAQAGNWNEAARYLQTVRETLADIEARTSELLP